MNNLSKLIIDNYKGRIPTKYASISQADRDEAIRKEFFECLQLETFSKKAFRQAWRENKHKIYAITEDIAIQLLNNGDLEKDSFFNQFVDVRNEANGDRTDFVVEGSNELQFVEFSGSHFDLRRTRVESNATFSPSMKDYGVKVYTYWEQVASGRIDFTKLVGLIEVAMKKKLAEIAQATFATALGNLPTEFKVSGSYTEADILTMLAHVEASNGQRPILVGTLPAVNQLVGVVNEAFSDGMKDELNRNGYISNWKGYSILPISNGHKIGTFEFTMDNDVIYALTGSEKPVCMVLEGDVEIKETADGQTNHDRSLEQTVIFKAGCAIRYNKLFGKITLA